MSCNCGRACRDATSLQADFPSATALVRAKLPPWVELAVGVAQALLIDVSVDLGRGDVGVA